MNSPENISKLDSPLNSVELAQTRIDFVGARRSPATLD